MTTIFTVLRFTAQSSLSTVIWLVAVHHGRRIGNRRPWWVCLCCTLDTVAKLVMIRPFLLSELGFHDVPPNGFMVVALLNLWSSVSPQPISAKPLTDQLPLPRAHECWHA